jgi:hypothetical protein
MTPRLLTPTVLRGWRLAWWTASFGVGAYAGYQIAVPMSSPGAWTWWVFGPLLLGGFWVFWTVVPIASAALVAVLVYRALSKGRLPAARTVMIGASLYVAGVAVGIVMTPVLGLEYRYREPVVLVGRGTMTLSLDGVAGYAARTDSPATCGSVSDGEAVSSVSATAIGTIDGADLDATVGGIDSEVPVVGVGGVPTVNFKTIGWSGPIESVERTLGGRDGRVTFVGMAIENLGAGDPVPGDWPATLSGTLSWSCGDWIGPVVPPGPGPADPQPPTITAASPSGSTP